MSEVSLSPFLVSLPHTLLSNHANVKHFSFTFTSPHQPSHPVHCFYLADGHGEAVLVPLNSSRWKGSRAEQWIQVLRQCVGEVVEEVFSDAARKADEEFCRLTRLSNSPTEPKTTTNATNVPSTPPPLSTPAAGDSNAANDPFAFPDSSPPKSRTAFPTPSTPTTTVSSSEFPTNQTDPPTYTAIFLRYLLPPLRSLHLRLNRRIAHTSPSLSADNGSTFLLTCILPTHIVSCTIGDSSMLLASSSGLAVPVWSRSGSGEPPGPCSYEDALGKWPDELHEGQTADEVRKDYERVKRRVRKVVGGQGKGWTVWSPRSAYGLGMTATLGNLNHAGCTISRTNVYVFDKSELAGMMGGLGMSAGHRNGRQDILGDRGGLKVTIVMVSDGVKDVLTAPEIALLSRSLLHGLLLSAGSIPTPNPANPPDLRDDPTLPVERIIAGAMAGPRDAAARRSAEEVMDCVQSAALAESTEDHENDGDEEVVRRPSLEILCRALVHLAKMRGSTDDVTALAIDVPLSPTHPIGSSSPTSTSVTPSRPHPTSQYNSESPHSTPLSSSRRSRSITPSPLRADPAELRRLIAPLEGDGYYAGVCGGRSSPMERITDSLCVEPGSLVGLEMALGGATEVDVDLTDGSGRKVESDMRKMDDLDVTMNNLRNEVEQVLILDEPVIPNTQVENGNDVSSEALGVMTAAKVQTDFVMDVNMAVANTSAAQQAPLEATSVVDYNFNIDQAKQGEHPGQSSGIDCELVLPENNQVLISVPEKGLPTDQKTLSQSPIQPSESIFGITRGKNGIPDMSDTTCPVTMALPHDVVERPKEAEGWPLERFEIKPTSAVSEPQDPANDFTPGVPTELLPNVDAVTMDQDEDECERWLLHGSQKLLDEEEEAELRAGWKPQGSHEHELRGDSSYAETSTSIGLMPEGNTVLERSRTVSGRSVDLMEGEIPPEGPPVVTLISGSASDTEEMVRDIVIEEKRMASSVGDTIRDMDAIEACEVEQTAPVASQGPASEVTRLSLSRKSSSSALSEVPSRKRVAEEDLEAVRIGEKHCVKDSPITQMLEDVSRSPATQMLEDVSRSPAPQGFEFEEGASASQRYKPNCGYLSPKRRRLSNPLSTFVNPGPDFKAIQPRIVDPRSNINGTAVSPRYGLRPPMVTNFELQSPVETTANGDGDGPPCSDSEVVCQHDGDNSERIMMDTDQPFLRTQGSVNSERNISGTSCDFEDYAQPRESLPHTQSQREFGPAPQDAEYLSGGRFVRSLNAILSPESALASQGETLSLGEFSGPIAITVGNKPSSQKSAFAQPFDEEELPDVSMRNPAQPSLN
ncbi:hypothetical protein HDU93_006033 [Gonapodya sp. JEL0774]|nr:hypothetical protein HDU93_006033 [Gonapodya sp. JEL0774]